MNHTLSTRKDFTMTKLHKAADWIVNRLEYGATPNDDPSQSATARIALEKAASDAATGTLLLGSSAGLIFLTKGLVEVTENTPPGSAMHLALVSATVVTVCLETFYVPLAVITGTTASAGAFYWAVQAPFKYMAERREAKAVKAPELAP